MRAKESDQSTIEKLELIIHRKIDDIPLDGDFPAVGYAPAFAIDSAGSIVALNLAGQGLTEVPGELWSLTAEGAEPER